MNKDNQIVIYRAKDGRTRLEVNLERETVWLTQAQMATLFDAERSVITKHIRNIFQSKELAPKSNVQKMHIAGSDKPVAFYTLDMIIAVGYPRPICTRACCVLHRFAYVEHRRILETTDHQTIRRKRRLDHLAPQ